MPGDLLDIVLLALIAAFAVAGYRQGFIIGALSLAGFVVGVAAGAFVAPGISRALAKSVQWQALIAIVVVFGVAVLGMMVASGIGVAVRSRLTGRPATTVDALGGAMVNVVAVIAVTWLIGSFLVNAPFPTIKNEVNSSAVLRTVDRIVPPGSSTLPLFSGLKRLLSANGLYSQVFGAIGAEGSYDIAPPGKGAVYARAVSLDKASIVKIEGVAPSCTTKIEGSGFVISPDHVLTNAHVVAGVTDALSVTTPGGLQLDAKVVLYDPQTDIAILYVAGLNARPLRFAAHAAGSGANAVVVGYPLNHGFTPTPARVGHSITAYGPDIYQNETVRRQIYPIRSRVLPGNSGGPLLASNGAVYGVVFAASTQDKRIGYALTAAQVRSDVSRGSGLVGAVSTEACQA